MTYKEFIIHLFDKFLEDNGLKDLFLKSISSRNISIEDVFNNPINYWLKTAIDPKKVTFDRDFWQNWTNKWLKLRDKYDPIYYMIIVQDLEINKKTDFI